MKVYVLIIREALINVGNHYTFLRKLTRTVLRIRPNENIADGIDRYRYKLYKVFNHKKVSKDEFKKLLVKAGINKGDTLIVHSAWRGLFMLDMEPEEVIDMLMNIVGEEGTLVMPAYGSDESYFDEVNSISCAGVLSECFRKRDGVLRSCFPKFSMCAYGKNAEDIVSKHQKSLYQFDENSPYSIAVKKYKAKILLLGMGMHPHKITVFHCSSYDSRDYVDYQKVYTKEKQAIIRFRDGTEIIKEYIDRNPEYQNNKTSFRHLFRCVPKIRFKYKGLSVICFDSYSAYMEGLKFCANGGKLYK